MSVGTLTVGNRIPINECSLGYQWNLQSGSQLNLTSGNQYVPTLGIGSYYGRYHPAGCYLVEASLVWQGTPANSLFVATLVWSGSSVALSTCSHMEVYQSSQYATTSTLSYFARDISDNADLYLTAYNSSGVGNLQSSSKATFTQVQ